MHVTYLPIVIVLTNRTVSEVCNMISQSGMKQTILDCQPVQIQLLQHICGDYTNSLVIISLAIMVELLFLCFLTHLGCAKFRVCAI